MQDSTAVTIARAHINAWSHQDWEKTRELVAPNVHVVATTTQPMLPSGEASHLVEGALLQLWAHPPASILLRREVRVHRA